LDFPENELPFVDFDFSELHSLEVEEKYLEICRLLKISAPRTRDGFRVKAKIRDLVKTCPTSLALQSLHALFLYAYDGPAQAVEILKASSGVNSHAVIRMIIAIIQCSRGKYENAIGEFYKAQDKSHLGYFGGDILLTKAIDQKARREINLQLHRPDFRNCNPFLSPDNVHHIFEEAYLHSSGLSHCHSLSPIQRIFFLLEAASLCWLQCYSEILSKSQDLTQAQAKDSLVLYAKGIALFELKELLKARRALMEAYQIQQNDSYLSALILCCQDENSKYEELRLLGECQNELQLRHLQNDLVYTRRGKIYQDLKQYVDAVKNYDQAHELRKSTLKGRRSWGATEFLLGDPLFWKANLFKEMGLLEQFLTCFEEIICLNSEDEMRSMLEVSAISEWLTEEELQNTLKSRNITKIGHPLNFRIGIYYKEKGSKMEALEYINRAIEGNPNVPQYHLLKGRVLLTRILS